MTEDKLQAVRWYQKAAAQGLAPAQYNLGNSYRDGEGTIKDYVEAYKWLNLAAAQAFDNAKINLNKLEAHMTRDQIGEAQRLAREFKPNKTKD